MTNEEAAKIIQGMLQRRGCYGRNDETYYALYQAAYRLLHPDCWNCDYFIADEIYNEETGEEYDASYCDRKNIKNNNEKAMLYIKECAESVGIEVIEGQTAFNIPFMAETMRRLREGDVE